MEIGLHVTLWSCMKHLGSKSSIVFHLFHKGFDGARLRLLRQTRDAFRGRCRAIPHDVAALAPGTLRKQQGSRLRYGGVHMANPIEADSLIHLDPDLVVLADLCELDELPMRDAVAVM